ncbi:TlpA family protein disulfide reductase [Niabella aquatica]
MLASDKGEAYLLKQLIHNTIAQSYIYSRNEKDYISIINKIVKSAAEDTNKDLADCSKPVYLWAQTLATDSIELLKSWCKKYFDEELVSNQMYKNYVARYGMAIYNRIVKIKELKLLADDYFNTIDNYFNSAPHQFYDSLPRKEQDERAWNKYYFASLNYIKAQQTNNLSKKEEYLKIASDSSPGIKEQMLGTYFYDQFFIFNGNGNESYKDEYISFLINHAVGNKKEILSKLTLYAIETPNLKDSLKNYYNKNSTYNKSFETYWLESINNEAKNYPPFVLTQLNNNPFSSNKHKGKWILLDFWGTWCGPCREEHPDLQKFYDSVIVPNSAKIVMMTIASMDNKNNVEKYILDKGYTFPVCLDTKDIYEKYHILGFPGKILITPQGKFFQVKSDRLGWIDSIKKYCNLE